MAVLIDFGGYFFGHFSIRMTLNAQFVLKGDFRTRRLMCKCGFWSWWCM